MFNLSSANALYLVQSKKLLFCKVKNPHSQDSIIMDSLAILHSCNTAFQNVEKERVNASFSIRINNFLEESQPFPEQKNLDSSRPKKFAEYNLKFGKNGRKFTKQVENAVGKGEIARYEQFLLFPQRFQKTPTADT